MPLVVAFLRRVTAVCESSCTKAVILAILAGHCKASQDLRELTLSTPEQRQGRGSRPIH